MKNGQTHLLVVLIVSLVLTPAVIIAAADNVVRDEDVKVVSFEDLRYPPLARMERVQGAVVVRVTLDDKGNVVESEAVSGAKLLLPDSLANAKKWRFRPNPSKAAVIVYNFRLTYGLCNTLTSQFNFLPPNVATITTCEQPVQP